ncbi:MAG: nuclease-related domain-containing protein [Parcubacteria group bacterium]
MANIKKKSPLKAQPLRYPGQSLTEEIRDIAYDSIISPALLAIFTIVVALLQWYEKTYDKPPLPEVWTFVAIVVTGYAIAKYMYAKKEISNRKLGRDGEREVGQFLESLRTKGYFVFHDLIGDGFNLDHIIIGPAGAFTIETKTWSKPGKGQAIIDYDSKGIRMNGGTISEKPIIQAKAQRDWLQKLILKITGRDVSVKAVVVYPGWFIKASKKNNDVWVLEPKALPKYLANEKEIFSGDDVNEISFQISRYIRSGEENKKMTVI